MHEKAQAIKKDLLGKVRAKDGVNILAEVIDLESAEEVKNILFELRNQVENLICVLGSVVNEKPSISVMISDNLVKEKNWNAGNLVKQLAVEIKGGGGGQAFYATAGGTDASGLLKAVNRIMQLI